MIRSRLIGLFALLFLAPSLHAAAAERITIDESKIRIDMTGKALLTMPVMNATHQPIPTALRLSLLDPEGRVLQDLQRPVVIDAGATVLRIDVSGLLRVDRASKVNYGWLRLKYDLAGDGGGIVSISRIAPEPFVMDVISPRIPVASAPYRVQVLARDPQLERAVPGVEIQGRVASEDEPFVTVVKSGRTNASGYAELTFDLPRLPPESDLTLEVRGKLGKFTRNVSDSVSIDSDFYSVTSTDKPIYQPGEKLRARALVFDRQHNALRGSAVRVSIWDPDDDKVFESSLVTSAFGEAHTEWAIPENSRVGNYEIRVGNDDYSRSIVTVWIGPYNLPNFSVDVRADRPYYVPGQRPEVAIHADYLFGRPVPNGSVRIVRELHRSWNYRELKWEVEEGETLEGSTDREGQFRATLSIDDNLEKLSDRRVFDDVLYAAYVTDPSTGRTEQRRFWIRITLFPIHLYIVKPSQARSLPFEFYVAASYADGSPAICDVEIHELLDESRLKRDVVTTNKYGVAKVRFLPSAGSAPGDDWSRLEFHAVDASGNKGQKLEYFLPDDDVLRVYTDKSLYRASEPVSVHVESTFSSGQIVLNASSDGRVLYSTALQLSAGKGDAVIPSSKAFSGSILISAYYPGSRDPLFDGRRVSFPATGGLEIESSFAKKSYAPGEEATLHLRLRNGNRSPQEGIFGVTVFDKAVEERARTDAEFGGRYSVCHLCGFSFDGDPELPGLTVADLHRLDRKQPLSPDLELAAEVLLAYWYAYEDRPWNVSDFEAAAAAFRSDALQKRFDALNGSDNYPSGFYLPADELSLRTMILKLDPEFDKLRDPWDNGYRLVSSVSSYLNQIEVLSSATDEVFKTADDFRVAVIQWPYFGEYGKTLHEAIRQHHERTGGYIRDIQTLRDAVRLRGQVFDEWHDPQGRPYTVEFGINRTRYTVEIKAQDRILWREVADYTEDLQPRIDTALNDFVLRRGSVPQTDSEVRNILRAAGIADDELKDPWKHPYYATSGVQSGYFDSVTVTGKPERDAVRIVPVTRQSEVLRLRSAGPDGIEGTSDDFTAFSFLRPISEQSVEEASPRFIESPFLDSSYGAVYGIAIDTTGALIPGVTVSLIRPTGAEITLITADDGHVLVRNLDPGTYRVRFFLPGFQTKTLTGVFVRAGVITRVVATLEVATVSSTVEVSADSGVLMAASASVGEVQTVAGSSPQHPISTPRLREYFPETLVWQPSLETRGDGRAQVRFKLADSITTWKAVAIASTKDGRIAVAEEEITAFQPFFVEHDPPKFLTEGDRIDLPVVVRSYLDRDQSVDLSMKNEDWFAALSDPSRKVNVKPGEFAREVFSFKASLPVKNGRQRVMAQGSMISDAIEKTSTVYPFGREMTQVSSGIFRGTSSHEVTVPNDALAGSVHAELKIYPNLMAHVVDAIEGIMQRPYGCAEQVISSAYPSLLFLNHAKQSGRLSDPMSQKARRYLEIALRTLRGYQSDEGGFSYWTRGEPNAAVTAYAVQFLTGAKEFIEFDHEIADDALEWLTRRQAQDGSWNSDPKLTAYIASTLSAAGIWHQDDKPLPLALAYLRKLSVQPSEPYTTASTALAALQSGDKQLADAALETLRSEVHYERDAAFWDLQTNTPFYGWGRPGRLESTAIVVRALAAGGSDSELVDKGLLFLLRNKDRFGVWYSSQATVRVLDALIRLVGSDRPSAPGSARILVNGVPVATVTVGAREQPDNPVIVDLSRFLNPGSNHVEVLEQKSTSMATVQLVESHYVPWDSSASGLTEGPLRYSVRYSNNEAAIGEFITVHVEAERIGFRGYGMMLAEIGLPPGAEVDRESVSQAIASSGWDLSRLDVLADRVIAYVWPRAGGTTFEFKFRPRYGLEAHAPASRLYDYYNPDAYSVLLPEHFRVH